MGYAIQITARAVEDQTPGIVAAEASRDSDRNGAGARLKSGKMVPQESGWTLEGSSTSAYAIYANTPPLTAGCPTTPAPQGLQPPFGGSSSHLVPPGSNPVSPNPSVAAGHAVGTGLGFPSAPGSLWASDSLGPLPRSTSGGSMG